MKVERQQQTLFECIHCQSVVTEKKGRFPATNACPCGRGSWRATEQFTTLLIKTTDADGNKHEVKIDYKQTQPKKILVVTNGKPQATLDPFDPLFTPTEISRITDCSIKDAEKMVTELLNAAALEPDFELNQTTNFYELAEEYTKQQPIYYDETKLWWSWSDREKRWVKTDDVNLLLQISEAMPNPLPTLKASKKHELLEALRRFGRAKKPKEPPEEWVQFADTMYDLKTGESFESTPEYFNKNAIPWKVGQTTETPILDKLFKEWVVGEDQDDSWVQTIYEVIAYCTLRSQPAQRLIALVGTGANGKGTFIKVINKFLGNDNTVSTDLKTLTGERFATADLYGKLVAFLSEADERSLKDVNQLKRLTGDDLDMRYEFKNKGAFNARSYATCLLACNELPLPTNQDIAYYRRWLVIDFPHRFDLKRDVLAEVPDSEYEALAAKCLEISKRIILSREFTNEGSIEDRIKRYDERANPVQHFINLNCLDDEPDMNLSFSEFCREVNTWRIQRKQRKMSHKKISALVRNLGYEVKVVNVMNPETNTRTTRRHILGLRWTAKILAGQGKLKV